MNSNLLLIIFTLLVFSCKRHKDVNIKKEIVKPVINSEIPEIKEKPKFFLNTTIKQDLLGGIWVSKQYDSLLKATHSLVSAEKKLKTYSDIIYNGDSILHCMYRHYQEAHGFKIFNDLSVGYNKNEVDFKITEINENKMTIKYPKGNTFTYYKIEKEIEKPKIYLEIIEGHITQEKKWFAGKYIFTINDTIHHLIIDENGNVTGKSPYKQCRLFTWYEDNTKKKYDVLYLKTPFEEESFMVELATDEAYHLQKINTFDGVGETAVQENKAAILKKDTEENYYEKNDEDSNVISLDELADENYTEPTQSEMNSYVAEKLTPNNNGVYSLDSLQKVYQDRFPKSKFFTIDNILAENDDDEKTQSNYFNHLLIGSKNRILMPCHKVYYIYVSNKNEMYKQEVYSIPFQSYSSYNLYDEGVSYFFNGVQSVSSFNIKDEKLSLHSLFHSDMKNENTYLIFLKLETSKGNVFYSDVSQIKCTKEYDYSELNRFQENIDQFESDKSKEYFFANNKKTQALQVFFSFKEVLFKLKTNLQDCEKISFNKANNIRSESCEYYVENKSEIKKIIFNKEKTKVKIVLHDDVSNNDCQIIEGVMELVKE